MVISATLAIAIIYLKDGATQQNEVLTYSLSHQQWMALLLSTQIDLHISKVRLNFDQQRLPMKMVLEKRIPATNKKKKRHQKCPDFDCFRGNIKICISTKTISASGETRGSFAGRKSKVVKIFAPNPIPDGLAFGSPTSFVVKLCETCKIRNHCFITMVPTVAPRENSDRVCGGHSSRRTYTLYSFVCYVTSIDIQVQWTRIQRRKEKKAQ